MKHKTPTTILGYTIVILAVGAAASHTMTTEAYGDHIDNNIWIETAEGIFTTANESTHYSYQAKSYVYNDEACEYWPERNPSITTTKINGNKMFKQGVIGCGNETAEKEFYNEKPYRTMTLENYHECLCGHWYHNTVKDVYKYTIIDLPRDREIPPDYNDMVKAGVSAGLNSWAKINDMTFTYTDSRLEADILIQQQIGNGRTYGNAEAGCLFDNQQCTIQLFTDFNKYNEQTLLNKHSIAWTIAHEFGHLIGLPHHIDPDHIMNTIHSDNTRTYYEARNINVVKASEPTYEQRLLGYEDTETETIDYTNITQLMEHPITTNFIEFVKTIIRNAGFETAAEYITKITEELTN